MRPRAIIRLTFMFMFMCMRWLCACVCACVGLGDPRAYVRVWDWVPPVCVGAPPVRMCVCGRLAHPGQTSMALWLLQLTPSVGQGEQRVWRGCQLSSPARHGSHRAGHSGGSRDGRGAKVPAGHASQPSGEVIRPFDTKSSVVTPHHSDAHQGAAGGGAWGGVDGDGEGRGGRGGGGGNGGASVSVSAFAGVAIGGAGDAGGDGQLSEPQSSS